MSRRTRWNLGRATSALRLSNGLNPALLGIPGSSVRGNQGHQFEASPRGHGALRSSLDMNRFRSEFEEFVANTCPPVHLVAGIHVVLPAALPTLLLGFPSAHPFRDLSAGIT